MSQLTFRSIGIRRHTIGVNGPGVTTLVAGYGCPLYCLYCINPDCHTGDYEEYTVSELMDIVKIDNLYFEATNGGITFGGGEPLLQYEFIHEFKQVCPETWKINIETSLNVPLESLKTIIDDVNLLIIDLKTMDTDIYKEYTGKSNAFMIQNVKWLKDNNYLGKCYLRYPVIPGYTTESDVDLSISELEIGDIHKFIYETDVQKYQSKRKPKHIMMGKIAPKFD